MSILLVDNLLAHLYDVLIDKRDQVLLVANHIMMWLFDAQPCSGEGSKQRS